ncbi:MAG: hypothetical protein ACM3MB_02040 [Acidobacteriota bacterium]
MIENLITRNTEKIIEGIHNRNKALLAQVNETACQDYYSRELFDSFKELLLAQGFMKDYFEAIQSEGPKKSI